MEPPDEPPLLVRLPLARWITLAPVALHLAALAFAPRVWRTTVEVSSRSGRTHHVSLGSRHATLLVVGLLLLGASYVSVERWMDHRRVGMREPSEAEAVVARWVVRVIAWAVLYGSAWALVRAL